VLTLLRPGGRLCIVAFHSLEDRIVKERFKHWARSCRCPRSLPQCRCEGRSLVRLLTRKVRRPEPEEMERNPRARSARLRALEKLEWPEAIREREDES
jgi:16S rRNA (cytosine1402-N4)-methyltransferase